MTGGRLKVGFALGAALAGMLAAALRITGVSDPATAVADEPVAPAADARPAPAGAGSTAAPAAAPPATPPVAPEVAERWRTRPAAPAEVTARVVSRAARAPAPARAPPAACPPAAKGAVPAPAGTAGGARNEAAPPCSARAEAVEIDWHAPAATP